MLPKRVLFIRFSAIGDILLVTPLIRLFHKYYSKTKIDFLVKRKFSSLIEHNPLVDNSLNISDNPSIKEIISISKMIKKNNYDLIFDFQKHWRSYLITLIANRHKTSRYKKYALQRAALVHLKKNFYKEVPNNMPQRYFYAFHNLDIQWEKYKLELFIPDSIRIKVGKKLPNKSFLIGVAPGAGRRTKQWPVDYYVKLIRKLQENYKVKILLLGDNNDLECCTEIARQVNHDLINWCGKTSLLESAAGLEQCRVLICNDSGLMHMATAFDMEIVSIFGPTVREFGFFPVSEKSEVIEHFDLSCRPCSYHGTFSCPKEHFRCMKEITPEQVFRVITKKIPGNLNPKKLMRQRRTS